MTTKVRSKKVHFPRNGRARPVQDRTVRDMMQDAGTAGAAVTGPEMLLPLSKIEADKASNVREDTRRQGEGGYGDIDSLVADFRQQGQLQAATVRPSKKTPGKYELIFGFRRLAAARKLGWETIRAQVLDIADADADWMRLRENEARHDLSSFEKSMAYAKQHTVHGWTIAQLAERSGADKSTVENHVRMATKTSPEVLSGYRTGQFNTMVVQKLATLDKAEQKDFVEGVGSRSGMVALESLGEFVKLGCKWDGNGSTAPTSDGNGETAPTTPAKRPGRAALAKALAWAGSNGHAETKLVLEWVLGKRARLTAGGETFDPAAAAKGDRAKAEKAKAEKAKASKAKEAAAN